MPWMIWAGGILLGVSCGVIVFIYVSKLQALQAHPYIGYVYPSLQMQYLVDNPPLLRSLYLY